MDKQRPSSTRAPRRRTAPPDERRPHRFALELPVWYRAASDRQWHTGTTENVSRTGVLIRADEPVVPSSPIVVAIALRSFGSYLVGRGRIARTLPLAGDDGLPMFAVAVNGYRINRRDSLTIQTAR